MLGEKVSSKVVAVVATSTALNTFSTSSTAIFNSAAFLIITDTPARIFSLNAVSIGSLLNASAFTLFDHDCTASTVGFEVSISSNMEAAIFSRAAMDVFKAFASGEQSLWKPNDPKVHLHVAIQEGSLVEQEETGLKVCTLTYTQVPY